MRVRATVAYDGTDYHGFQRQVDVPTVQGALEGALLDVSGQETRVIGAGRTDAGVHAIGQVIAFDTNWRHPIGDLQRALNAVLPSDVAVRDVEVTEDGFHPRFDARRRSYRYTVYNARVRCPIVRRYSHHVAQPLDLEAMEEAARLLVGERDFATFGQPPQGTSTVRRVLDAHWEVEGPQLDFYIEANAFLYRMVRSIVGTLFSVGRGWMSVGAFQEALDSCERHRAGTTAPACGLCMLKVTYPT